MAIRHKLKALDVSNAATGRLYDGDGLMLDRSETGGKWLWRYTCAGKRREMGLGTYPAVTLAAARKARDKWAAVLASGADPVSERTRIAEEDRAALERADPPFSEVAAIVFEARKAGLRGDGLRGRWWSPLATHILPKIGAKPLSKIRAADIKAALAPIWKAKPETARKAVDRIGIIYRQAKLMGLTCDPFVVEQARHMLGEVQHEAVPIPSTPWRDVPALYARLGGAPSHQALKLVILTVLRSHSVRGAQFGEIDGDIWTVPAERMKGDAGRARPFRVPLSTAALALVQECRDMAHNEFLFPSLRTGHLSDMAMNMALRDMKIDARPHGFRSSFRTWVQETDACTFDVAETVLAHSVGGKVERSYARSDLLDKRREVLEAWGRHVTGDAKPR